MLARRTSRQVNCLIQTSTAPAKRRRTGLCYDPPTTGMSWTIDRAAVFKSNGRTPRYEGIASAIETALERGELKPGDRLPTVRALASQLQVSSASVAVAYSLLERRGRLRAHVGRGTFVRQAVADGRQTARPEPRTSDNGDRHRG